ncbi:Carbonic anhydrase, alpha-class [Phytophthora cactorum]|nr:Carbonic anhydrase, alpha-class [Phytophthora cactorum]
MSLFALLFSAVAIQSALAEDREFTYKSDSDALSPSEWAGGYPACGGLKQSPIDITDPSCAASYEPSPVSFAGSCPNYNMTVASDSYMAAVDGGNCTVTVKKETYKYAQFHVHTPSEHTIDGKAFDGEIHFVHKKADGSGALVIGLFLKKTNEADTEPAVDAIVDAMSVATMNATIPMTLYRPVFNYAGSLTTPPCTEFVEWWVIRTPARISSAQFDRVILNLAELDVTDNGKNARPVQPLNQRAITTYN